MTNQDTRQTSFAKTKASSFEKVLKKSKLVGLQIQYIVLKNDTAESWSLGG